MVHPRRRCGSGVERISLPGGLALAMRREEGEGLAAVRVFIRGGSIAEWPVGGRGLAHLLEHVAATRAAEEMDRRGDAAILRAFTTREHTGFAWHALPEDCAPSLRHLFDALDDLASTPARLAAILQAQRQVVLEEISLFLEQRVSWFQQCFLEEAFDVHPIRYPISGQAPLVARVAPEELADYLRRIYVAPNITVALAGEIDPDAIADTLADCAARLPAGPAFALGPEAMEPARRGPRSFEVLADGPEAWTLVGFPTEGSRGADRFAFEALAREVNERRDGLRRELEASGLARDLSARNAETAFGAGCFSLLARHAPERRAEVEARLLAWIDGVARGETAVFAVPIPEEDGRTLDERAARLGEPDLPEGGLLDPRRIAEAVSRRARPERMTTGTLGPPAPARTAGRAQRPMAERETVLPNGVRLLVLPTTNPQVCAQVLAFGGLLFEPAEAGGLDSLLSGLLPASLPEDLAAGLKSCQGMGARFLPFSDESFTGLSFLLDSGDPLPGLRLLAAMALRPDFREEELEKQRRDTLAWLAEPRLTWSVEALRQLRRFLYPGHPYGRDEEGTPASLARLSLRDIAACHRRLFVGGGLAVVVAGAMDADRVFDELGSLFAAAPSGPRPVPAACGSPEPRIDGASVPWRRRHGGLALGFSGVPWEAETWAAVELIRTLLAGPRSNLVTGRLLRAVRDRGAAYQVQILDQTGCGEGYLGILAACGPDKQAPLAGLIDAELERLRDGAVPEPELDRCRRQAVLQRRLDADSPRLQSYTAGRHLLLAGESGSWRRAIEDLRAVSAGDIAAAAGRFLRKDAQGTVLLRPWNTAGRDDIEPALRAAAGAPAPVGPAVVTGAP
ncbi:MAG: M16 family metallopeptidase [Thermoanaerobaculia bacterium]